MTVYQYRARFEKQAATKRRVDIWRLSTLGGIFVNIEGPLGRRIYAHAKQVRAQRYQLSSAVEREWASYR